MDCQGTDSLPEERDYLSFRWDGIVFFTVLGMMTSWFKEISNGDNSLAFTVTTKRCCTESRPVTVKGPRSWERTELGQLT